MMGKTHLMIGIASGLGASVLLHYGIEQAALITVASAMGSLLPDIDHPRGMIRQRLGLLGYPLNILPHRGPTHTLLAVVLVSLLYLYFHHIAALGLLVGYASHLVADMITVEGIPLLFPLSRGYISVLPIRTGGLVERVLALGVTVGAGYLVYLLVK